MSLIARHVDKSIGSPASIILKDINLSIEEGEFVALTGRSGSGKSTLLYLLSSLDFCTNGEIEISGRKILNLTTKELCRFRNEELGFIFQFHYLIAELSALENVLFPARKLKRHLSLISKAKELLDQFGLANKFHRLPRQLSGGEQQRVAIARALIMSPRYLFADEPTGSLDSINGQLVMDIIRKTNKEDGTTILLVTHEPDYANLADRQIHLVDGKINTQ